MAFVLADRVKETTSTSGTSDFVLSGAATGFQSFSAGVGANNTTYYAIADGSDWEIGLGTLSANGLTLARTTVLQSSNSDTKVSFSSNSKQIFVTYPADKAVLTDATQTLTNKTLNSPTFVTPVLGTPSSGTVTNLTGTASININGTVGATTASTGAFTTLTTSSTVTHNGGTANGVTYLNGSKVLTSGSALTFDGTNLTQTGSSGTLKFDQNQSASGAIVNTKTATTGNSLGAYDQFATKDNTGTANTWAVGVNINSANSSWELYNGGTRYSITQTGTSIWSVGGTEGMRLTSTGLGIGTSSPSQKLHVASASNAQGLFKTTGAGGGSNRSSLILESPANTWYINTNGSDLNGTDEALGFYGNSATRMVITNSGNVGIGTTSPSNFSGVTFGDSILDVNGVIQVRGDATNGAALMQFGGDTYRKAVIFTPVGTDTPYLAFSLATSGTTSSGSERARITSDGNLLVAKTALSTATVGVELRPGGRVVSTLAASTDAADTTYEVYSTGAGAYRFYVGMGGTIFATSIVISAISDQRLKENVRDIDTGLDAIMALKPRRFDWKEGKGQDKKDVAGFIAQEFETVFPECVSTSKAGADGIEYKNINHETLIPTLVKAIQELKAEFDAYKASHP